MLKGLERLEQRAVQQMSGEIVAPVEHDGKPVDREAVCWDSPGPMDGWAAAAIAARNEGLTMELIDPEEK